MMLVQANLHSKPIKETGVDMVKLRLTGDVDFFYEDLKYLRKAREEEER